MELILHLYQISMYHQSAVLPIILKEFINTIIKRLQTPQIKIKFTLHSIGIIPPSNEMDQNDINESIYSYSKEVANEVFADNCDGIYEFYQHRYIPIYLNPNSSEEQSQIIVNELIKNIKNVMTLKRLEFNYLFISTDELENSVWERDPLTTWGLLFESPEELYYLKSKNENFYLDREYPYYGKYFHLIPYPYLNFIKEGENIGAWPKEKIIKITNETI